MNMKLGDVIKLWHFVRSHPHLFGQVLEVLVNLFRCTLLLYPHELLVYTFPYPPLLFIILDPGYVLPVYVILSAYLIDLVPPPQVPSVDLLLPFLRCQGVLNAQASLHRALQLAQGLREPDWLLLCLWLLLVLLGL